MRTALCRQVFALAAALCAASAASATVQFFHLEDHPDGAVSPPPYGLRLDGIFNAYAGGGTNDVTTFSFNTFNDVTMKVTTTGPNITMKITGTVHGGRDTGAGYGFGAGDYDLEYNITANLAAMGTGWFVSSPSNGVNQGTLTAHAGIGGIVAGTVFNFYESNSMGNPFKVLQDDHRLTIALGGQQNYAQAGQGYWVGRGWNTFDPNGTPPTAGTQDWLFLGSPIVPLPSGAALAFGGLMVVPAIRRRR